MNEAIAHYFMDNHPGLWEIDELRPQDTICVRFPIAAPKDSILRTETAIDTLERVKKFSIEWIKPGHINGDNTHNVSATISIDKSRMYPRSVKMSDYEKVDEWVKVGEWMWENRDFYNGLSVLPYWGGTYSQAPFEDITEEEYNKRSDLLKEIDLTKVTELDDNVEFSQTNACAGGACETNI
jgi:ribonucleoside-diphosphate reductase alpha chain